MRENLVWNEGNYQGSLQQAAVATAGYSVENITPVLGTVPE
jgi:hypothetical protein